MELKENSQLSEMLKSHVYKLAQEIGERSVFKYDKLAEAARYISEQFTSYGYQVEFHEYTVFNQRVKNIIATRLGTERHQEIIIVGAHYGGKVAVKYVTNFPGKISKLILLAFDPAPFSSQPDFDKKRFEKYRKKALKSPSWFVMGYWKSVFPDSSFESLREWGLKSAQKTPPEIFRNGIYNYWKEDVRPLLEKIDIPTLIICGNNSPYDLKQMKFANRKISGSKTYIFEDMNSTLINMFAPNKFNQVLEDFITTDEIENYI